MSQPPSRSRSPHSSTVGHLGPVIFPTNESETDTNAATTVQWARTSRTLQLPIGGSHEPSPVRLWCTSPSIMNEGTEDEEDTVHFTLQKSIDPSKFMHLFCIKPKLSVTSYTIWSDAILHALQTVSLHVYLNTNFTMPKANMANTKHHPVHWQKANLFVCSVLTAAMTEE